LARSRAKVKITAESTSTLTSEQGNQMAALRRYLQDPEVREILFGFAGILSFAIVLVCFIR
jgi:hypothetical protein